MTTINEISAWFETNDNMLAWGIELLKQIGTYTPEAVVRLKPVELASILEGKLTPLGNLEGDVWASAGQSISKASLLRLATETKVQLEKMGYLVEPVLAPEAKEFTVKVKQDTPVASRSLKEKLMYGLEHPEEAWEVLQIIEQDVTYKAAALKATQSFGYPLCLAFVSGGLVVDATIEYLSWLSREFSTPQMEWDGCELGTLRQALKIEEKLRVHPLVNEIISGPDAVGINYLPLDEKDPDLWDAIVWARITNNPLFPSKVDLFEMGSEIIAHIDIPLHLSSRWERIRKAFKSAKRGGNAKDDLRCEIETVKKKAGSQLSLEPLPPQVLGESDYKKLVMKNLDQISPARTYQGSGCDIKGIFRRLIVQGSVCDLNCILIEGGTIQGSEIDGVIKIPEWSAQPSIFGSGCDVDIKKISWKIVAEEMGVA